MRHNEGNYVISLGNLCRWLGQQAESLGVEIYAGFPAQEALFDDDGAVRGVLTGDLRVDRCLVNVQTRIGQQAIDGRRADLKEFGLDDRIQIEVAVPFHSVNQLRNQRLQALATHPVGRFPQHRQRLAYGLVV